ncbi:MAG: DUF362 domain-containing protein [Bacteroidales bacterium]|nr:DUF362 domain-containing protein [Candidatus Latescibacterota bacterium]
MAKNRDEGSEKPKKTVVSVTRSASYEGGQLRGAIEESLAPFGGLGAFVKSGQRVLLKPNLLSAKAPDRAITTHPDFVRAIALMVREKGAEPVIGDSPGGAIRGIQRVWNNTGITDMAASEGIELVNFEASGLKEIESGEYRLYISKPVLDADVIINLAKLKTHTLTLLTCGVKNIFGVVPGFRKAEYHKIYPKPEQFAGMLVELYRFVNPALTIVDGILSMEGNGPSSGMARNTGVIIAGKDAVAVDAVAARMIGFEEGQVDTTRIAGLRNIGTASISGIEITGNGRDERPEGFQLPSNRGIRLIPGPLVKMIAPLVWLKLEIDPERCTKCEQCLKSCPVGAIDHKGDILKVDHKNCIQCMCCHELCPEDSIDIRMSWLARLFA